MKHLKYLLFAVIVISGHQMDAMKALENEQGQVSVPSALAYNPKKAESKGHPKKGQKAQIAKAVTPYTGYRKLALIICDPSNEKLPKETLEKLDTGFTKGVSIQTATFELVMLIIQKTSPILVCNAFMLENMFLMEHGTQAFMNKTGDEDSKNFKEHHDVTIKIGNLMRDMLIKGGASSQTFRDFFEMYQEEYPYHEEEMEHEGEDIDITEILDYPLNDIDNNFFLYEYNDQSNHTAYLLVPRNGSTMSAIEALKKHGFNEKVFKQKDIKALKAELKKGSTFDYSAYVKKGTDYTYEQLGEFSNEALKVINTSLMDDEKNPWVIYMMGHGVAGKEEHSSIAGFELHHFTEGLLPILIDKNTLFAYVLTCDIGGINRDRLRDVLKRGAFDAVPKIAQEILGKKELKYPNNMITLLGGISDVTTMAGGTAPLPTKDLDVFKRAWGRLDAKDPLVVACLPFVQEVRYDLFFDQLIKRLQTEEARGTTTRAALEPWKEVLKHATPYNVAKDQYIYNNIPQIRFPGHDTPFNVVDVDERIQVLRYVDVKARELGGKLAGKGGQPIKIENKEMVIVHPLSVNVPLDISGTYPSLVSARADIVDLFFSKITCHGDKNLQNTIHALFTFEAGEKIYEERYFLVDELEIKSGVYKDVLVMCEPTSGEIAYSADNGSEGRAESASAAGETGSQAGDEPIYGHYVKTTVYYRTPESNVMKYQYDHKAKVKEIAIPEMNISNDIYEYVAFTKEIEAVKLAVEQERYINRD